MCTERDPPFLWSHFLHYWLLGRLPFLRSSDWKTPWVLDIRSQSDLRLAISLPPCWCSTPKPSRSVCSATSCSPCTPMTALPDVRRTLLWYEDDTIIISCIMNNDESSYREEIHNLGAQRGETSHAGMVRAQPRTERRLIKTAHNINGTYLQSISKIGEVRYLHRALPSHPTFPFP